MRTMKKILVVACVLALLLTCCVVAAMAAGGKGSVAELKELVTAAENAKAADEKYAAVMEVAEYLSTKTIDSTEAGYDKLMTRVSEVAVAGAELCLDSIQGKDSESDRNNLLNANKILTSFELDDGVKNYASVKTKFDSALVSVANTLVQAMDANIENTLTTAKNKTAVSRAKSVVEKCTLFGTNDKYDSIVALYNERLAAHERATAINYQKLDDENIITNYDLPIYYDETWEKNKVGMDSAYIGGKWGVDLKGTKNLVGIGQEENGNQYYIHQYLEVDNPAATYINLPLKNMAADFTSESGFVIEFDITCFEGIPEAGILIETGSVAGQYFPPPYFRIDGNGNIINNSNNNVILENAIVLGEWLHVALVFDYDTFVYKLYVEGQYITSYDAKYNGTTTYNHNLVAVRLTGGASKSGDVAYDNIKIYAGNSYRTADLLKNMNEDELFIYYTNYIVDENKAVSGKNTAYNLAGKLLEKYGSQDDNGNITYTELANSNEALKAAVDNYFGFDYASVVKVVKAENIVNLVKLVEELGAVQRSEATIDERKGKAETIQKFLDKNAGFIDLDADANENNQSDYVEYTLLYETFLKNIEYDANASSFVKFMLRYDTAVTLSAKERYYGRAKELVDNDGIDLDLINDENHKDRANFLDLIEAYEIFINANEELDELSKNDNSHKIILCVNRIKMYDTEEKWIENSEEMNKYLDIIKPIVLGTDANGGLLYNPNYDGIDSALRFFNDAYGFFFARLQDQHVEYISGVLESILNTDSYIEKMGMTAAIERYVDTNEVDFDDARIIKLLNDYETCKAELLLREDDYAILLIQNSVYFTNIVEKMRTSESYVDQKNYYEQAALLYFNIDATVEGTAKAIVIFEEYMTKLALIEESSVKFVEAVALYNACETADEKYAALVECYANAKYAEASYEGVSEAMVEYTKAYEAYVGYANAVNADLAVTGNAIGSVRVNCGVTVIIAIIIKKIFGV